MGDDEMEQRVSYERDDLIAICERAVVPKERWHNRDSWSAQQKVGACWVLLRSGHDFTVLTEPRDERDRCVTDDKTIWLRVTGIAGFSSFEMGDEYDEDELIYLPTPARLERAGGGDWY